MTRLKRVHVVHARWCPHCHPLTVEAFQRWTRERGVELRLLDIDVPAEEREADTLVRAHGDWSADYLIPQVLFEFEDGTVQHVFTGHSEGVAVTKARLETLLANPWLEAITTAAG